MLIRMVLFLTASVISLATMAAMIRRLDSGPVRSLDCRPRVPESFEIISTVGIYVSRALSGELSAEEAMKKANEEIKALLQKSGYNMSE